MLIEEETIPAEFHMISGCLDRQKCQDVKTNKFELPNLTGNGGACTSTLLKVLYRNKQAAAPMSWVECLRTMRTELNQMGYIQIPELTSSRLIDVNEPMHIVPPGSTGRRIALLIGISYEGQLPGCHNDVKNIKQYLIDVQGFKESDLYILMDDGGAIAPTKRNIEDAFARICQHSVAGDVVFVHYSGHGGRVFDTSGDEEDGLDSTLLPVDYLTAGQIVDDDILEMLVKPMRKGVTVTVLMDCCHSGTVLDLPYRFSADDAQMTLRVKTIAHSVLASGRFYKSLSG